MVSADRSREDLFRELELILEAKKNINNLAATMYSVFLSLEGFLVYAFFTLDSATARVAIAAFAAIAMIGLAAVTGRFQGTNDRCDTRALSLESTLGAKVISNYYPTQDVKAASRKVRVLRMHSTLIVIDWVLVVMWIVLAILEVGGRL